MLEHQTSDRLLDRMDQYLGQPAFDPHGEPIPDKQGNLPESKGLLRLTDCPEGKQYKIVKINPGTDEITLFFKENGFQLGKSLFLNKKYKDIIEIRLEKIKMFIPGSFAGNIFVTV
jgi:DtxR family Mn-dependent transcriptional regulator